MIRCGNCIVDGGMPRRYCPPRQHPVDRSRLPMPGSQHGPASTDRYERVFDSTARDERNCGCAREVGVEVTGHQHWHLGAMLPDVGEDLRELADPELVTAPALEVHVAEH